MFREFWLNYSEKNFYIVKIYEQLRKILKTLEYFLVKFELISCIEVK